MAFPIAPQAPQISAASLRSGVGSLTRSHRLIDASWKSESQASRQAQCLGLRLRRFLGKADTNQQAITAQSVESDPQETLRAITVGVGWARRTPSRCTNRNSGAASPTLRLLNIGGTHVEDHSNPGFRAVFRCCTGDVGGRHPMVDHAL